MVIWKLTGGTGKIRLQSNSHQASSKVSVSQNTNRTAPPEEKQGESQLGSMKQWQFPMSESWRPEIQFLRFSEAEGPESRICSRLLNRILLACLEPSYPLAYRTIRLACASGLPTCSPYVRVYP